jgi:predicted amidohydrolase YtcJ
MNEKIPNCADTVIINAEVYTADVGFPRARAVAVRDGRIVCVGANEDALAHAGADTRVIDAGGRALAPGMVDAHQHMLGAVRTRCYNISLTADMKHEDYLDEISRYIAENPQKEAYTGTGFMTELYGCCGPRKEALDAICPDKPIVILSYDGHTTWVNSKALEVMGVDRDTPDPDGGVIRRDPETGEPTGYLAGSAGACEGGMMRVFMPGYTREQNKRAILMGQDEMFRSGVTCIYDAHVDEAEDYFMAYEELAREGRLKLRVRGSWFIPRETGGEQEVMALIDRCLEKSRLLKTDRFQVNGFKFLCDQICEAETAYMCEPYSDRPDGWCGVRIWEDGDVLARAFARIDAAGFQIHVHQIGDGAAKYVLDALERAEAINGGLKVRHTFAHCQFITEADKARMARLGVMALTAPYWINSTIFNTIDVPCLGRQRAYRQYPVRSLMDAGVIVGHHSDYTVSHPDWCASIYGLTVRNLSPDGFRTFCHDYRSMRYTVDGDAQPAPGLCCPMPSVCERLEMDDAIRCITLNGARSMYIDGDTGSLEVGKQADMVLLDREIEKLVVPDNGLVSPQMTMLGGEIVFEK